MTTTPKSRRGAAPKYPWASMGVDDSFLVPLEALPAGAEDSVYLAGYQWARGLPERKGCAFVALPTEDGGVRVWCTFRAASLPLVDNLTAFPVEQGVAPDRATFWRMNPKLADLPAARQRVADMLPEALEIGESFLIPRGDGSTQLITQAVYGWKGKDWNRRQYATTVKRTREGVRVTRIA